MTLQVEDIFPKNNSINRPNRKVNQSIEGSGNFVDPTAINVVCFGDSNSIGQNVKDSQIFNSSGCVIPSGLKNVTIFNSSGIVVTTDDVIYINNNIVSPVQPGLKITRVDNQYTVTSEDQFLLCDASNTSFTVLLRPASAIDMYKNGFCKIIRIKKIDSSSNQIAIGSTADLIDGDSVKYLTAQYESLTLITDGANYNII